MTIPNNPIVNAGLLYVNGLQIGNTGANLPLLSLLPGAARDSTNVNDIALSSPVTLSLLKIGATGLDTGTVLANTFYAVHVIGDSTDHSPTTGLFSLASFTPLLPFGYDMFRRVGWILTDSSSNIVSFYQGGVDQNRIYYYLAPINVLTNGTATTFTNVNMATAVPSIQEDFAVVTNQVFINITYTPSIVSNYAQFNPINSALFPVGTVQFGAGITTTQFGTITVPSRFRSVAYKVFAGDTVTLNVTGYTDYLGL